MPLHRALHVLSYVTALWSFTALATTGELPLATIIIVYLGILASVFKNKVNWTVPRWLSTILTLLAMTATVLYCLPDVASRLLGAVIHFFFYLEIVKLCARHPRAEDYLHIVIISFFQIVATAVSTQSWVFLIIVVVYIAMACTMLVLVNARRDAEDVERAYDREMDSAQLSDTIRQRIRRGIAGVGVAQVSGPLLIRFAAPCLLIVIVSAGIFMVIPRFSANRPFLGISKPKSVQTTGFSSDVDLQRMDQIFADPTIVMRVYPDIEPGENFSPHQIYMRATSLDNFNNRRWSKSRDLQRQSTISDREFLFDAPQSRFPVREVKGRVASESPNLSYAFTVDFPIQVRFKHRMQVELDDEAYSLKLDQHSRHPMFEYTFRSVEIRSGLELHNLMNAGNAAKNIGGSDDPGAANGLYWGEGRPVRDMPDAYRRIYLRLPSDRNINAITDRVSDLALSLIHSDDNDLANAIRLQNYLSTNYKYTLDLRRLGEGDPLESFLFERREGHCELFSTALAQMLRSVNIPARVVSGYLTDEWNSFGNYYVVREYNAHAWVEAWIERIGWVRLDATPVGAVFAGRDMNPILATLSHYLDSFKVHWYRYVIDYDLSDQQTLVSNMHQIKFGNWSVGGKLGRAGELLTNMLATLTGVETSRVNKKAMFLLMAAVGLFLFFAGLGLWQIGPARFFRRKAAGKPNARQEIVAFYYKILENLNRRGIVRAGSQTAGEFAFRVASDHERFAALPRITRIYYRLRFSGGAPTQEESAIIRDFFENLD